MPPPAGRFQSAERRHHAAEGRRRRQTAARPTETDSRLRGGGGRRGVAVRAARPTGTDSRLRGGSGGQQRVPQVLTVGCGGGGGRRGGAVSSASQRHRDLASGMGWPANHDIMAYMYDRRSHYETQRQAVDYFGLIISHKSTSPHCFECGNNM